MAETFRISRINKFLNELRSQRKVELAQATLCSNRLIDQYDEISDNKVIGETKEIEAFLDNMMRHSYEKEGISFTHSEFSFLFETIFHLGCTSTIDNIIKEMGAFFDIDIPERKMKIDIEKYQVEAIDTTDYSNFPRKFCFVIGGMSESYSEQVREEIEKKSLSLLLEVVGKNKIDRTENGFVIESALQNIPDIADKLVINGIGVYGIIPIKTNSEF